MKLPRRVVVTARIPGGALASLLSLLALLTFVSSVHEVDRTPLSLPPSSASSPADRASACVTMSIEPGKDTASFAFSDGREASRPLGGPTDVYLAALRVVSDDRTRPFVIKADAVVPYELVDEVLEQLRKAGVGDVTLLTLARTAGSRS